MSMALMAKAMNIKVGNPLRKLVLIKLADNANDKGECWPSYQHIADQCEIDRSTVRRHIKDLEKDNLLTIENRTGANGCSSNLYILTLDGGKKPSGSSVGTGSTPVGTGSTPVGTESTPPVGTESTRTSHSFEPVNEPTPLTPKAEQKTDRKPARSPAKPKTQSTQYRAEHHPLPDWLPQTAWDEYCQHRDAGKKPLTELAAKKSIAALDRLRLAGNDPVAVIDQSIANGWQGLFDIKQASNPTGKRQPAMSGASVTRPRAFGE